jgi:hypothetical protein
MNRQDDRYDEDQMRDGQGPGSNQTRFKVHDQVRVGGGKAVGAIKEIFEEGGTSKARVLFASGEEYVHDVDLLHRYVDPESQPRRS